MTGSSMSARFHTTALNKQEHPSTLKGEDIPDPIGYYLFHPSLLI